MRISRFLLCLTLASACGFNPVEEAGGDAGVDAGVDAGTGTPDASVPDAGPADAGLPDSGVVRTDPLLFDADAGASVANPFGAFFFGGSVALSGDGSLMVVGAPNTLGDGGIGFPGAVFVFARSGADFGATPIQTLSIPPDTAQFGLALALAPDGTLLAVAGTDTGDPSGTTNVFLYARSGPGFGPTPVQVLLPLAFSQGFGKSLALSGDGSLLAIGDIAHLGSRIGGVHLYQRTASGFPTVPDQTIARPAGEDAPQFREFGGSVALSSSGDRLFVADPLDGLVDRRGAVHIFERMAGDFAPLPAQTIPFLPGSTSFGQAIATTGDGSSLLISDLNFGNNGAVHVFGRADGGFAMTPTQTLSRPGGAGSFGSSLALTADGSLLAVGDQSAGPGVDSFIRLFNRR